jgi:hypothetical protein
MKPEHSSAALPRTARIDFGRAYAIDHQLLVQPLGLPHPASMETLLDQFEANVFRKGKEPMKSPGNPSTDSKLTAADVEIVKDMRQSIIQVLGSDLSRAQNLPPQA